MALRLYKIHVQATTDTDVVPTVQRFFYLTETDTASGAPLTINAEDFVDDNGTEGVTLPELDPANSYYQVFINGVLQQQANTEYTPGSGATGQLVFNNPASGGTIYAGTPVVLKVVQYNATSTTNVEA